MNINDVSTGSKQYIFNLVDDIAENDFIFNIAKPIIKMGIENNFNKVTNLLKLIADENNNIDVNKLIDETISSVFSNKKVSYDIGSIGTIDFGDNCLKLNIFNKYIKFEQQDFIKFKNYLIEQYGN